MLVKEKKKDHISGEIKEILETLRVYVTRADVSTTTPCVGWLDTGRPGGHRGWPSQPFIASCLWRRGLGQHRCNHWPPVWELSTPGGSWERTKTHSLLASALHHQCVLFCAKGLELSTANKSAQRMLSAETRVRVSGRHLLLPHEDSNALLYSAFPEIIYTAPSLVWMLPMGPQWLGDKVSLDLDIRDAIICWKDHNFNNNENENGSQEPVRWLSKWGELSKWGHVGTERRQGTPCDWDILHTRTWPFSMTHPSFCMSFNEHTDSMVPVFPISFPYRGALLSH